MQQEYIEFSAAGEVHPIPGANTRHPYQHQLDAIKALDQMDSENSNYSTLVVLPTGGGKTYTASTWLLRHAIDKGKKILPVTNVGLHGEIDLIFGTEGVKLDCDGMECYDYEKEEENYGKKKCC